MSRRRAPGPEEPRWQEISAMFTAAVERPPEQWGRFVDEQSGDEEVKREVRALLSVHQVDGGVLDRPLMAAGLDLLRADRDQLGEGARSAATSSSASWAAAAWRPQWRAALVLVAVFGVLLTSLTVVMREQRQTAAERDRVEAERARAEEVSSFLVGLFGAADPYQEGVRPSAGTELIDRGLVKVRQELGSRPALRDSLLHAIGVAYHNLGELDLADAVLNEALEGRRSRVGLDHPESAATLSTLGQLALDQGRYELARERFETSLRIREGVLGKVDLEVAESLTGLGTVAMQQGDYDRARSFLSRALEVRRASLSEDDPRVAYGMNELGFTEYRAGEFSTAEPLLTQALELLRSQHGEDHPETRAAARLVLTAAGDTG